MSTADDAGRPGEAASRMLQLLNACLTTQALHVIAELGIADRLADGPAAIDDLAAATGAHRPSLYRPAADAGRCGGVPRGRGRALRLDPARWDPAQRGARFRP